MCGHWFILVATRTSFLGSALYFIQIIWFTYVFANVYRVPKCRAGLKSMQPMQLHWTPRLWGLRTIVFGKIVNNCQTLLELKNSVETAHSYHC